MHVSLLSVQGPEGRVVGQEGPVVVSWPASCDPLPASCGAEASVETELPNDPEWLLELWPFLLLDSEPVLDSELPLEPGPFLLLDSEPVLDSELLPEPASCDLLDAELLPEPAHTPAWHVSPALQAVPLQQD